MNAKQLIAAVAVFAAAGSVFAADVTPFAEQENFISTKTRAEVRAEVLEARTEGLLASGDIEISQPVAVAATKARVAARKDAVQITARPFDAGYDIGS